MYKRIILFGLVCMAICLKTNTKTPSTQDRRRAINLVKYAPVLLEQIKKLPIEYLNSNGFKMFGQKLQNIDNQIKAQEDAIETALQGTLNTNEKKELEKDRKDLYRAQVMMNAQVPNEVNEIFATLENIRLIIEADIREYRKEIAQITPKLAKLDTQKNNMQTRMNALLQEKKGLSNYFALAPEREKSEISSKISKTQTEVSKLQTEIAALDTQRKNLFAPIQNKLRNHYQVMIKNSRSLFEKIKRIKNKIKEKAPEEFEKVNSYHTKLQELEKCRYWGKYRGTCIDPGLLKQRQEYKQEKERLYKEISAQIGTVMPVLSVGFDFIVDLLHHTQLTTNLILYGPKEIDRWNLEKDIFRVKNPKTVLF